MKTYVVITAVEPNAQHGTGNFLREVCGQTQNARFISFRGLSIYNNICDIPGDHFPIPKEGKLSFMQLIKLKLLAPSTILCMPFYENTVKFALYLQKHTNAKLFTYFLDDQNLINKCISDQSLKALLLESDKTYAISDELSKAYRKKFSIECTTLHPKVVSPGKYFLNTARIQKKVSCAIVGNIWTNSRLMQIANLVEEANLQVSWFGLGPDAPWLNIDKDLLQKKGIKFAGYLPQNDLFKQISKMSFIILPSGDLDKKDKNKAFSKYSMPSRLFFCGAHTNTPFLVLGHKNTALAKFIRKNKFGVSAEAKKKAFQQAIRLLQNRQVRKTIMQELMSRKSLFIDTSLQKYLFP
jgi:hypothetical protein